MTRSQREIFFQSLAFPKSGHGNIGGWIDIKGVVEANIYRRATCLLPVKHRMLTATFAIQDGYPVQRIGSADPTDIEILDFRQAGGREACHRFAAEEFRRPFDLLNGKSPWLCRLLIAENEQFYSFLKWHHIIADGLSVGLMITDIHRFYDGIVLGQEPDLTPVASTLETEREETPAEAARRARGLAYWLELLPAAPEPLFPQPCDPPVPSTRVRRVWEWADYAAVEEMAAAWSVPVSSLLLAALSVSLSLRLGRRSLVIGTPLHNRIAHQDRQAVGPFVNVIPVPVNVEVGSSFRELVERVAAESRRHYRHHGTTLGELGREWGRSQDASDPLDVTFSYEPVLYAALHGSVCRVHSMCAGSQMRALQVYVRRYADGEDVLLDMDIGVPEPGEAFASAVTGDMLKLLAAARAAPDLRIGGLALLSEPERALALAASEGLGEVAARPPDLSRWFAQVALREGDRIAVRCGAAELSYAELERRSAAVARRLIALGVGPEVRVGLACARSLELVIGLLGIVRAGGAYVPLDPAYPEARLAYMVADSALLVVLADEAGQAALGGLGVPLTGLAEAQEGASEGPLPALDPEQAAYVIYTSGSTGQPKGCVVSHRNAARLLASCEGWLEPGAQDVWTLFHSYAFDFSVWELWGGLLYGGRLVVVPLEVARDPLAFLELLEVEQVTVLNQTPSAFRQLAAAEAEAPASLALRWVIFGGEALEPSSLSGWVARHPVAPRLMNMYGITETTVHVTARELTAADVLAGVPSLVGRALGDMRLSVLDEGLEPLPAGAVGELYIGGAGVSRGYLGKPALTASRFLPDPFGPPGSRLYRSGDLGRRLAGGELEYLGRADQQVKIRGFRIELGEVEAALLSHEGVADATVGALPGPSGLRLVAWVVGRNGAFEANALRSWLATRLPEHQLPAAFVGLDRLPLTANGKLDRAALPAPESAQPARTDASDAAPRTATEVLLTEIWAEVLPVGASAAIGRDDNFFACGGDSIVALRLIALAKRHGLAVSLRDVYETGSLAALAGRITADGAGEAEPALPEPFTLISSADRALLPADAEDAYPPSALQAGMLFHSDLTPGVPIFHDIFAFDLELPWHEGRWEQAAQALTRHAALRTGFAWTLCSQPVQIVHREAVVPVCVIDLRDESAADQTAALAAWLTAEKGRPFDITQPPLFRLSVHRLGAQRIRLWVSFHHAILDGWSLASLITELVSCYLQPGRAPAAVPSLQARLVIDERAAVASPESSAFWAQRLVAGALAPSGVPSGAVRRVSRTVDPDLAAALSARAVLLGVPLKTLLLSAHLRVLALFAGEHRVSTGYVVNVRPEVDGASAALGLFLNTVPFTLDLPSGTWAELVQAVQAEDVAILAHRGVPSLELKRRAGGRLPYVSGFNFVHFHVYDALLALPDLAVLGVDVFEQTDFPLLCQFTLNPARNSLELTLVAAEAQLSDVRAASLAELHLSALTSIAWTPDELWHAAPAHAPSVPLVQLPPAPPAVLPAGSGGAPSGKIELRLAELWAEVLALPPGTPIGRDDNFFASGGDSIVAARLAARIRSVFAVNLRLQALFNEPTFAAVAADINGERDGAGVAAGAPVRRAARSPVTLAGGDGSRR